MSEADKPEPSDFDKWVAAQPARLKRRSDQMGQWCVISSGFMLYNLVWGSWSLVVIFGLVFAVTGFIGYGAHRAYRAFGGEDD